MSDREKQIEQFVLAKRGGVMLPMPINKVCELLLEWDAISADLIPSERRCPQCNYRKSGAGQVKCPVDGTVMIEVTWREACLAASRIASTARKRVDLLEAAWPAEHAMPTGHEIDTKSLEEKIDILRDRGLYEIVFREAGVGLVFFEPPEGVTEGLFFREVPVDVGEGTIVSTVRADDSWKQYLKVHSYYQTLDEAVGVEWNKRK